MDTIYTLDPHSNVYVKRVENSRGEHYEFCVNGIPFIAPRSEFVSLVAQTIRMTSYDNTSDAVLGEFQSPLRRKAGVQLQVWCVENGTAYFHIVPKQGKSAMNFAARVSQLHAQLYQLGVALYK